jgi:hypothetical protein
VITAVKFYRWEISNLTKMVRVGEWVQVGGHWRPRVLTLQDLGPGGDTTTVTFTWHEQPGLPAAAFKPSGLRTPIPGATGRWGPARDAVARASAVQRNDRSGDVSRSSDVPSTSNESATMSRMLRRT